VNDKPHPSHLSKYQQKLVRRLVAKLGATSANEAIDVVNDAVTSGTVSNMSGRTIKDILVGFYTGRTLKAFLADKLLTKIKNHVEHELGGRRHRKPKRRKQALKHAACGTFVVIARAIDEADRPLDPGTEAALNAVLKRMEPDGLLTRSVLKGVKKSLTAYAAGTTKKTVLLSAGAPDQRMFKLAAIATCPKTGKHPEVERFVTDLLLNVLSSAIDEPATA